MKKFIFPVILLFAIYVRVYNVDRSLGFYYDQGRDAGIIWNFIKNSDLFLVGPTTGIAGIFRGPWYYWLIAPFYFLGGGNPVWPAVFLSLTTVVGIYFLYLTAKDMANDWAGIIAGSIASFSYYIVVHSRWLSNPAPMLLISILTLWSMVKIAKTDRVDGLKKYWYLIGFLVGMAIQFGSAAEVFYIPIIVIFGIFYHKKVENKKTFVLAFFFFFVSFVPQIVFDILKKGILSQAIISFLFQKDSFRVSIWEVLRIRLDQYWHIFSSIVFLGPKSFFYPFVFGVIGVVAANYKKFLKNHYFLVLLFLLVPAIGMLFFQGNYGNVFDYYYSGYYFPMILLFSVPLGYAMQNWGGKIAGIIFLILFFSFNAEPARAFILRGRTHFTFSHQKEAIEWIYKNAGNQQFNVDVYVPPVIPYAYDYLFKWLKNPNLVEETRPLLFTLYELDPPHPERLKNWLDRQDTIAKLEVEYSFGGITVQRRKRN